MRNALAELPDEQRDVIQRMYFDGMSQSQIAERTGLPLGTVKSRTLLAMRRLRASIGEDAAMTRDHALIDELLAVRALGGLDEDDAAVLERELAAHGDCAECRRLEAEHTEVAGMLALALDPVRWARTWRTGSSPDGRRPRPGRRRRGAR